MIVCSSTYALRERILNWKSAGLKVGFVPTMGNLHQGHLSLIDMAKQQTDKVVASVFVNPLQFGEGEDFDCYPRTLEADKARLQAQGCDLLFCPSVDDMYPEGALSTRIQADPLLASLWEGAKRPGHFDGVTTVVAKLFNLVQPDVAVFGQKDYQQWTVLNRMVSELAWPIEMIKAPIARDGDGLALSSRNQYLTVAQRAIAPKLYVVLQDVVAAVLSGNHNLRDLEKSAVDRLQWEGFDQVDYLAIVDPSSLKLLDEVQPQWVIMAVARLGNTRLLDNIEFVWNEDK
jgi:pantoate--beta-alanine ligase